MDRILARVTAASVCAGALVLAAGPALAGDPAAGKTVFMTQCSTCHSVAPGGVNVIGPSLFGVVGRKAGSVKAFAYSPAMKASGVTWTDPQLRAYLANPRGSVPGNKMPYMGVKNPVQLDNLIAYLKTVK